MSSRFDERVFRTLPLLVMAAAAAGGVAWGPDRAAAAEAWPWLVSLVVVGLPHGAADWTVSRMTWGRGATLRLAAVYVAGMAAVLALFIALPLQVIAVFAGLSVWHFGMTHADGQDPPIGGGQLMQGVAALARGGLVLGVPMARWPDQTAAVAADVVGLVTGRSVAVDAALVRSSGFVVIAITLAAFLVEAVVSWRRADRRRRTLQTGTEVAVIAALGLATPPLFAVGLSFLCWHAWRQMRPLAAVVADVDPVDARSLVRGLTAIHLAGLPLLVPTWIALAVAWWVLSPTHAARDLALLSLVAYLIVTPSHDLLLDLMRQRSATSFADPRSSSIPPSCAAHSASCSA